MDACAAAKIEPLIALGRERHHVGWRKRFAPAPKAPSASATAMQKMAHRLRTPNGKKLYALRKQTPEPVFGIIKSVMGFGQFSLRGFDNVERERNLVAMSWNIRRIFALSPRMRGHRPSTHTHSDGFDIRFAFVRHASKAFR